MARMPTLPAIDLSSTGINLHSGDIFNAQLTYNGTMLTVVITDTVTNASATQTYTVNIPAIVGGPTAYVGFTGGTGGLTAHPGDTELELIAPYLLPDLHFFSGFSTRVQLTLNGGAALNGTRLRLTDGSRNEARSAFFTTPVNIQQFPPASTFSSPMPTADGFTFTIQGVGPTALGRTGGSLGYHGIPNSVAVKFDLVQQRGRGAGLDRSLHQWRQSDASRHQSFLDGDQSAQRRHLQRATHLQRHHTDGGDHRYGDERLGNPDLYRQYSCDCRRPDGLCRLHRRKWWI